MRIALITPGFSADESDWCIPVLLNIVRELSRIHEVEVFTLRYPHQRDRYRVYDATVHAFGGAMTSGVGRLPLLRGVLTELIKAHRRKPFDLLHGFWADEPGFLAMTAGRIMRRPSVVSLMGGELACLPDISYGGRLSRANRLLTRLALRGATSVTTGSSYLSELASLYVAPERLTCLPLGVDTDVFAPPRAAHAQRSMNDVIDSPGRGGSCALLPASGAGTLPRRASDSEQGPPLPPVRDRHLHLRPKPVQLAGEQKILQVASLVPVKDQALLLRAMAIIAPQLPGMHLHLVGSGPLQSELEQLARALGLSEAVTFHGDVPHDQLPRYYRAVNVSVLTSRYESQCLVVLEALACGLPVVGTAVGILPDLGSASLTVPVGDSDALAGALLDLLTDPIRQDAMRQSGLAAIQAGYSLPRTIERLENLYLGLIKC